MHTLGTLVSPLKHHSLTSGGASIEVALASSTNGSLIMLITNPPLLFLTLLVVSLSPPGAALRQDTATTGGQLVIFVIDASGHRNMGVPVAHHSKPTVQDSDDQ